MSRHRQLRQHGFDVVHVGIEFTGGSFERVEQGFSGPVNPPRVKRLHQHI
jgi:hypothetical protein